MATPEPRAPLQPGEPAPDFSLPAVNSEGLVSLADYRGRSPVLVAINRGLYCPFCRRHIAQLGITQAKLRDLGVETLVIVATSLERARLYFRFRPSAVLLASDQDRITHRAFGLPSPTVTPELMEVAQATRINPTGELTEALPIVAPDATLSGPEAAQRCFFAHEGNPLSANAALNRLDGFEPARTDRDDVERQFPQLVGQFLIDREGIVRWANVECAKDGLAGAGKFPTEEELLAAARALPRTSSD